MNSPATLDRAGIQQRIPHAGAMGLLDRLDGWTQGDIRCSASSHRNAANPLRSATGLLATNAIEYAAQAMALHGSLVAAPGTPPSPGYIASVRNVRLAVLRLDDIAGDLQVHAARLAGGANEVLYAFSVRDDQGGLLAEGRAAVVLDSPLPAHAAVGSP